MCINPMKIDGKYQGEISHVKCRKCRVCIQGRKRHWIGRMMAEEMTCHSVWFMTLTYAGGYDNVDAYWINYRDVQLMFKKLRNAGHRFKYVAVGEHGTDRERAHFHIMMFWQNEPPAGEMSKEGYTWDFWEHGTSYLEVPRSKQGCAVYIMDYLNKTNLKKAVMKYSKNPMLGSEYLIKYAEDHVSNGLSLFAKSDRFTLPNNPNKSGQPFYYPVGRETALYTKMMDAYLLKWAIERPDQAIPLSEDLKDYLSDLVQDTNDLPRPLQAYIAKHYGYEPTEELHYEMETTYSIENVNLIHRGRHVSAEIYNERDILWHGHVANLDAPNERLSNRQLSDLLRMLPEVAPPRVHRFINLPPPTSSSQAA